MLDLRYLLCFTFGYCYFDTLRVVSLVYVVVCWFVVCVDIKKACLCAYVYCDIQESLLVFALFMGKFDSWMYSVNYGCECVELDMGSGPD